MARYTKYNVGDKVMVRADLCEKHGAFGDMLQFAGKPVTISHTDAFGNDLTVYNIEEDRNRIKFLWSDKMFEGVTTANPMPELTTGMFGKTSDGDLFIVVNDLLVYQHGTWDWVKDVEKGVVTVDALYDSNCFDRVKADRATVIWERNKDESEDDDIDEEELDELKEFIDFLYSLFNTDDGKDDAK